MKKTVTGFILACSLLLSGCSSSVQNTLQQKIVDSLHKCVEQADPLSSNPFDYMKGIPYRTVLMMGQDAVDVLLKCHEDGTFHGVMDYIAMYLVWDINDETDNPLFQECETAQQMYDAWMQYMQK